MPPTALAPNATVVAVPSAGQATTTELTRALALALQDQGLRERVRNDLRESRHTSEHKLAFSSYLHANGGILLAKMAKETGRTSEEILALLRTVPPMEFYMPVAAHRAAWTGGDNLIVASQLVEGQAPLGYRVDGSPVTLTTAAPPDTPVLAIVPEETDFSDELPASDWRNSDDLDGRAIGTMVRAVTRAEFRRITPAGNPASSSFSVADTWRVAGDIIGSECDTSVNAIDHCDDGSDDGTGGAPAVYPTGIYVYQTHLNQLGEDWVRGSPEIELFVIGPTFDPANNGEKISCSGEHATSVKHYDQNTFDFQQSGWTVEAQILSKAEIDHYNDIYNAQYTIQVWEDDQTGCDIVFSDRSQLEELLNNLAAAGRATSTLIQIFSGSIDIDGGTIRALYNNVVGAFESEDDPLGHVVYTPGTTRSNFTGDSFVDADLVLPDGTSNGTITIRTVNTPH